jgi:hypothetical protein
MAYRSNYHRSTIFLIVTSFTLLVLVSAFHHHHDGTSHTGCSLCVAAHQQVAVDHQDNTSEPATRAEVLQPKQSYIHLARALGEQTSLRGPPH